MDGNNKPSALKKKISVPIMKKKYNILVIAMLLAISLTSCLKKDLPNLQLASGNDIVLVNAEYRFNGSQIVNGQPVVDYQKLDASAQTVDLANTSITVKIVVPASNGDFTDEERAKVSLNKLWLYFNISAAATMKGISGTPDPGYPTDCSKPLKYQVTAANGAIKTWTITVVI
jgi:hypothetical protein